MVVIASVALLSQVQAVSPAPDGCYPNYTTAKGCNALNSLTNGAGNSGFGWYALFGDSTGNFNTAVGGGALALNNADSNTAVGTAALLLNTSSGPNVAVGTDALVHNDDGGANNAVGAFALLNNVSGSFNNAHGREALWSNTGDENNAFGDFAMLDNTTGSMNTAMGDNALENCVSGSSNLAIGKDAGINVVIGDGNIYIGAGVHGPNDEDQFIRVGDTSLTYDCFISGIYERDVDAGSALLVYVDGVDKLGTALMDANGNRVPFKPQAMLDESLKQQKRIVELEGTVARLAAVVNEQAAQIQKVSAQLEASKPAPQVVNNP